MTKKQKIDSIVDLWIDNIDLHDLIAFYRDETAKQLNLLSNKEINGIYRQNVLNEEN